MLRMPLLREATPTDRAPSMLAPRIVWHYLTSKTVTRILLLRL
jgi:hypothetical protein